MLELINRAKIIFIICIAIIVLFTYFVIFRIMKLELQETVTAGFGALANSKHASIENAVHTCVDGTKSLSSRTMINEKIVEYLQGTISIEELELYTQPKYVDDAMVIENIISAIRIVDGNIIAEYIDPDYTVSPDAENLSEITLAKIDLSTGNYFLTIDSPVSRDETLLAIDRAVYDMSQSIVFVSDEQNNVSLISGQEAEEIELKCEMIMHDESYLLCSSSEDYIFIKSLLSSVYVMITTPRAELMKPINQLTAKVLLSTAVVFLAILTVFYITIIRFANKLLETAEKSRHRFENLAYRDELTGAYSRIFLDFWKENMFQIGHPYCIIMIDLDELKDINDVHGHLMGDEILKVVAKAVTKTVRTGDIFIRFGGDEFLIILENVKEGTGDDIMRRIVSKLNDEHDFDLDVSISYGVYAMDNENDINDAILMADRRMYMTKKQKKEMR